MQQAALRVQGGRTGQAWGRDQERSIDKDGIWGLETCHSLRVSSSNASAARQAITCLQTSGPGISGWIGRPSSKLNVGPESPHSMCVHAVQTTTRAKSLGCGQYLLSVHVGLCLEKKFLLEDRPAMYQSASRHQKFALTPERRRKLEIRHQTCRGEFLHQRGKSPETETSSLLQCAVSFVRFAGKWQRPAAGAAFPASFHHDQVVRFVTKIHRGVGFRFLTTCRHDSDSFPFHATEQE